jgi:hypothetical protein
VIAAGRARCMRSRPATVVKLLVNIFFKKYPQAFAEGSVKEYKRAETAKQANEP